MIVILVMLYDTRRLILRQEFSLSPYWYLSQ